jgi:hypothetical protein
MDATSLRHSRRHFLAANTLGIGSVALAWLLRQEGLLAETVKPALDKPVYDLRPKTPHHEPRAKAMISLWMQGGPSHIDLFDPKPEMTRWDGKSYPGKFEAEMLMANSITDKVMASPWKFQPRGQCGMELSELLPHIGEIVDEITLIRSMHTPINNHGQSVRALQAGRNLPGLPALGSWVTYGLGSVSQDLPAFVALTDTDGASGTMPNSSGIPVGGIENWSNGYLPSLFQGTVIRPEEPRILNLVPSPHLKGAVQDSALDLLKRMNQRHLNERPGQSDLEGRIATFELAARMQLAATEALDLSQETEATRRMYGLDDPVTRQYGANCLLARRLIERGVRFVQVYTRSQFWDHHFEIVRHLPDACRRTDQPSAALVKDLRQRGLLDTTIVQWGGEMGRTPVVQAEGRRIGRDHNTYGFSMWLAGGGFRRGHVHGATDEFGFKAVQGRVSPADYHATLLHLLGLDIQRLVFTSAGREQSLTSGDPCRVVSELLDKPAP